MKRKYKLLIADDEFWIREKIRKMLDWGQYYIEFLEPACDGEDVLRKIEENKPDILITDINMPYLNGVELLKILQERYPDIIKFVVSGYDDFEYVKNSFLSGSIDYLMKPVNRIDLVNALSKALEIISEKDSDRQKQEKEQLEVKKAASLIQDREFSRLLENNHIPPAINMTLSDAPDFSGSTLVLIKFHNLSGLAAQYQYDMNLLSYNMKKEIRSIIGDKENFIFNHVYRSNEFIMITSTDYTQLMQPFNKLLIGCEKIAGCPVTIAVSENSYSLESMQEAYVQAVALLMTRRFTKSSMLLIQKEQKKEERVRIQNYFTEIQEKELQSILKSTNRKAVRNFLMDTVGIQHCEENKWSYLEVKQTVKRILNLFTSEQTDRADAKELIGLENIIEAADKTIELLDVEQIKELLEEAISGILSQRIEENADSMKNTVLQIVDYVKGHYFENITLSGLASRFNVEKSYLSRMFRKETGENLMYFLSEVRMENAKKYMKQNEISLTEIAFMVGYDDYTYFNKVFRKMEGISPREYRNKNNLGMTK